MITLATAHGAPGLQVEDRRGLSVPRVRIKRETWTYRDVGKSVIFENGVVSSIR